MITTSESEHRQKLILIIGFLPILILCSSIQFYYDMRSEKSNADRIAENTSKNIQFEISEKIRHLNLFSEQHTKLLSSIIKDTENIHLISELTSLASGSFPDNFAISIADNSGEIILDDFEGYIGDVCRIDLKNQLETNDYKTRLHPNPNSYHYDISTEWTNNDQQHLVFASFKLDRIVNILKSNQMQGIDLILTIKKFDYLIEATAKGDRSKIDVSNGYKLVDSQVSNILSEKKLENSYWTLVAIKNSELYYNKLLKSIIFYALTYILYILFVLFTFKDRPHTNKD